MPLPAPVTIATFVEEDMPLFPASDVSSHSSGTGSATNIRLRWGAKCGVVPRRSFSTIDRHAEIQTFAAARRYVVRSEARSTAGHTRLPRLAVHADACRGPACSSARALPQKESAGARPGVRRRVYGIRACDRRSLPAALATGCAGYERHQPLHAL